MDAVQRGGRFKDRTGLRYGCLVVMHVIGKDKFGHHYLWLCRCDCGNEKVINSGSLRIGPPRSGASNSCGSCIPKKPAKGGNAARNMVLGGYKGGASERGYAWELSEEEFDKLTSADCYYCGSPPSTTRRTRSGRHEFVYNGIDRVDNTLGYTPDNVVTCCYICNRAKGVTPPDDFMLWIKQLVAHQTREF